MKKLLLLIVLLCTSLMQALAYEWTDANGVTWTFSQQNCWYDDNGDGNLTNHEYYTITGVTNYGDDVVIPETVYIGETPYTIEAIGGSLFSNNMTLSSVALPATIKYIEKYAFRGCQVLTTVTGTENCEFIGYYAFYGCSNLTGIDLSACKNILESAFDGCSNLADIVSVSNCKFVAYKSFQNCTSLLELDLSDDVYIGDIAFGNCISLQRVGSLKGAEIGDNAFNGCTSLESVDIAQSKSLGEYAFCGCFNLTTVGDLSAYTSIGNGVFSGCEKLESANLSNCQFIGRCAFESCRGLKQVDLSQVKTINEYAFSGCENLEEVGDISSFKSIPNFLFNYCRKLKNVSLPNVTSVGDNAFAYCDSLTTINLPQAITIGGSAFYSCSSIANISLPQATTIGNSAFYCCSSLNSISLLQVTTIDDNAFYECTSLNSINLPKVTTIGSYAFYKCASLNSPNITSTDLTSVDNNVFSAPGTITLMATVPATLASNNAFGSMMVIRVPDASVAAYRAADLWSDFANRIVGIGTQIDYEVTVSADNSRSTLHETIGEDHLQNVVSLKVTGDINSYDIMVMRNKMDNLHELDLTDANIVANNYEYVTGYHTEDNVFPSCCFQNQVKLLSVKLPKSIIEVGYGAFSGCSNLIDVEFQTGIKVIGPCAFQGCKNLRSINLKAGLETIGDYAFGTSNSGGTQPQEEILIIPDGVTNIGSYAFGSNINLKQVAFPTSLKTMGYGAFYNCYLLESISLPTSLESIPSRAFERCWGLTRVDIPSTITFIGDQAFRSCSNLNDVYTYIVEPTPIEMNTFSNYTQAILHVPSTSYYNYWYNTQWGQFRRVEEFMAEYQYFYINNDFTIGDEKGTISAGFGQDDPDADLNGGSGLIVETSTNNKQYLDEMHIKAWGEDCASVITANNLEAEKVYFDIEITANRWYFLAFPFDVKKTNITAPGKDYVFRVYSAEERAQGNSGWQNWTADMLEKGQGYIFKCSKGGTLSLCVEKNQSETPAMSWAAENRPLTLTSAPAEDEQDASWNFLGNPQTSYYDIDKTGYTQPITVWNGSGYEAVRAEDDAYALKPFEAFFVQKPNSTSEIEFPADGRYTQTQWKQELTAKAEARRTEGVKIDRQLVNLVLTDGQEKDKTRVVFNEKASKDYEIDCDAAKFMSSERVPQLYTIDQRKTRYAINERPMGEVRLGYKAINKGEMTIMAVRMDQPVMLRDTKLQITHDLSVGDYTFTTEAGTNEDRFVLVVDNSATNVGKLRQETGVSVMAEEGGISFLGISEEPVNVYSIGGVLMAGNVNNGFLSLPKATYLVKVGTETAKVIVR